MKKINKRRLKYGANNFILIIAAAVIFVLLNLLAAALSEKFPATRVDLTENGMFEIGDATKGVLAELDESGDDVTIYYMKGGDDEDYRVKEVILKYLAASKNLKYEVKYFNRDPAFVQRYTDGTVTEHSLIVDDATKDRHKILNSVDLYEGINTNSDGSAYATVLNVESRITNALDYCISDEDVTVCFLTDHGEPNPAEMGYVLGSENITPTTLSLKNRDVPQECGMLYIISPVYDFTAEEIERLDNYLDRGGSVQIAIEPYFDLPRLESYLAEWGVTLGDNIIAEGDPNYSSMDTQSGLDVIFPQVEEADVNGDLLDSGSRVFATLCRSVNFEQDMLETITCQRLLRTTRYGMSYEMAYDENGEASGLSDGAQGTYALAVYLEKTVGENYDKTARLLVAGTSSLWGVSQYAASVGLDLTGFLMEKNYGNNAFFVGSTYEMLGLNSTRLTISGKSMRVSVNVDALSTAQKRLYRIIFCFALPIIIILAGIAVWLRRRHL